MPWIRFKRWSYLNPLAPHAVRCISGNYYVWKGDNDGATLVPNKADVEELLNSLDGRPCDYEVCWEKHGVAFDGQGIENALESATGTEGDSQSTVSVTETVKRGPGRPKKLN